VTRGAAADVDRSVYSFNWQRTPVDRPQKGTNDDAVKQVKLSLAVSTRSVQPVCHGPPARAQRSGATAALEEVIVTARKREETLLDVSAASPS
jgi:hypothetical protein